jgi:DNA-binding CsgD family transcriptional regulator
VAERSSVEALARFADTPLRFDHARTHLLFGEWLRGEGRRIDARQHLVRAHDEFADVRAAAFAERAGRELRAIGEKFPKAAGGRPDRLTSQEEHIVRLARDGRTNREIGAELFISARTVEWHLGRVFAKLGIASRRELVDAPPRPASHTPHSGWPTSDRAGPCSGAGHASVCCT